MFSIKCSLSVKSVLQWNLVILTWWGWEKSLRYPRVWNIEVDIGKENLIGTSNSLWYIHNIQDIDVRDTKVRLCVCVWGLNICMQSLLCVLSVKNRVQSQVWTSVRKSVCTFMPWAQAVKTSANVMVPNSQSHSQHSSPNNWYSTLIFPMMLLWDFDL